MTTLKFTEHQLSPPVALTWAQQVQLREVFNAAITPEPDSLVRVRPGARVGAARLAGMDVVVEPKTPIGRILTMIAVAADPYHWQDLDVSSLAVTSLPDALATLFARSCLRTFERGVYRTYRTEDARLPYLKGKLDLPRYLRVGRPIPIPVHVTVHDDDVPENQILRAGLRAVRMAPGLSEDAQRIVNQAWLTVHHVSPLPGAIEAAERLVWNRHNGYYQQAVALALFVLRSMSAELDVGRVAVPGFVIRMPSLVEAYIRTVLRGRWGLQPSELPDSWRGRLWLDEQRGVSLNPDLGVRVNGRWTFVGDVKYKILDGGGARPEDVYQMLAYMTATGLEEGTLIYAGSETSSRVHTTPQGVIRVVGIDLSRDDVPQQLEDRLTQSHAM